MNETLMQYSQEEIESILQCSYYDRRTDYVWKYIMGDMQELENVLYPIPSLESFQAMHDMLKKRNMSVDAKYIIDQTAPLVAYTGPNEIIRELYKLVLNLDHNDRIRIKVSTSQWWESGTFDLEDYEAKFRVWWSQLLLSECKYAKQCALDPEHNHPLYLSF